jgi:hypothetical protein
MDNSDRNVHPSDAAMPPHSAEMLSLSGIVFS